MDWFKIILFVWCSSTMGSFEDTECIPLQNCSFAMHLVDTQKYEPSTIDFLRNSDCGYSKIDGPLIRCPISPLPPAETSDCITSEGKNGTCKEIKDCNSVLNRNLNIEDLKACEKNTDSENSPMKICCYESKLRGFDTQPPNGYTPQVIPFDESTLQEIIPEEKSQKYPNDMNQFEKSYPEHFGSTQRSISTTISSPPRENTEQQTKAIFQDFLNNMNQQDNQSDKVNFELIEEDNIFTTTAKPQITTNGEAKVVFQDFLDDINRQSEKSDNVNNKLFTENPTTMPTSSIDQEVSKQQTKIFQDFLNNINRETEKSDQVHFGLIEGDSILTTTAKPQITTNNEAKVVFQDFLDDINRQSEQSINIKLITEETTPMTSINRDLPQEASKQKPKDIFQDHVNYPANPVPQEKTKEQRPAVLRHFLNGLNRQAPTSVSQEVIKPQSKGVFPDFNKELNKSNGKTTVSCRENPGTIVFSEGSQEDTPKTEKNYQDVNLRPAVNLEISHRPTTVRELKKSQRKPVILNQQSSENNKKLIKHFRKVDSSRGTDINKNQMYHSGYKTKRNIDESYLRNNYFFNDNFRPKNDVGILQPIDSSNSYYPRWGPRRPNNDYNYIWGKNTKPPTWGTDNVETISRSNFRGNNSPRFNNRPRNDLFACGREARTEKSSRIIGGFPVALGEYPWMVLIQYTGSNGIRNGCGGSLINSKYFLTAAHCVDELILRLRDLQLYRVILGEYDTRRDPDCVMSPDRTVCAESTRVYGISSVIKHPNFERIFAMNDVALVKLDREVIFSNFIKPICLPPKTFINASNESVMVAGWGKTEVRGMLNPTLHKAVLPVVDKEMCNRRGVTLNDGQICLGLGNGIDTCTGDSGGPMMVQRLENGNLVTYQFGVISYGFASEECGKAPSVNTFIPFYLDWIYRTIYS